MERSWFAALDVGVKTGVCSYLELRLLRCQKHFKLSRHNPPINLPRLLIDLKLYCMIRNNLPPLDVEVFFI